MSETDKELVEKILEGNSRAAEQIVRRHQKFVFNVIYHYLGKDDRVEDIAQEVFMKFFQHLEQYDTGRPIKNWLGRITANRCLDELRRRKTDRLRFASDLEEDEENYLDNLYTAFKGNTALSESDATDCLTLLSNAMDQLSPKDRMAFVLREVEDLDYAAAAQMLGCSQLAARIRVSRAKKHLQKELGRLLHE
jgi:RNA polymerase sigma-70 factor (ECF subfamily)